ncbi:hypothetical protein QYE76_028376 [Lolium multiflorum]|uniref:Reverse transcriptase zinc-binding domain-containing protein n=1 Tax=Lolium multiflorum TaxID=4521 RepID=A0AAD8QKW7_LOLMU|nr:hypothetical protein QYE76_028376 [Lolium multiflorum]
MDIFYAATTIAIGNGCKTSFWDAPRLEGRKPKDIAPLIFASSKRKSWKVNKALESNAWVRKITLDESFTTDHLSQFVELWVELQGVHLNEEDADDISWKLTANGQYSAKSAYELHFLGSTFSSLHKTVWKAWAPPKVKFFAWLLAQNRIWTVDRLQKWGWTNCELSSSRFVDTKASGKLAKIFSDTSFESSADSVISSDSDSVDSFNFIDKSDAIGKVFTNLYDGVTNPDKNQYSKYHQVYAIEEASRAEPETSEAFDDLGNPYVDPADLEEA